MVSLSSWSCGVVMTSTAIGSWSACLALVLSHSSCSAAATTSLHLVACGSSSRSATAGAHVDINGGAANFISFHSSSAAGPAVAFACRRRGSDADYAGDLLCACDFRAWEASSGSQPRLREKSAFSRKAALAASASRRLYSRCALAVDGDAAGASTGCSGARAVKRGGAMAVVANLAMAVVAMAVVAMAVVT